MSPTTSVFGITPVSSPPSPCTVAFKCNLFLILLYFDFSGFELFGVCSGFYKKEDVTV
jgi:hypothetical protein